MVTDHLSRTPGAMLISSTGVALWTLQRWWRIRHLTWAPGQEPDTPLSRARRAVAAESLLVLDAELERRQTQERGGQ